MHEIRAISCVNFPTESIVSIIIIQLMHLDGLYNLCIVLYTCMRSIILLYVMMDMRVLLYNPHVTHAEPQRHTILCTVALTCM